MHEKGLVENNANLQPWTCLAVTVCVGLHSGKFAALKCGELSSHKYKPIMLLTGKASGLSVLLPVGVNLKHSSGKCFPQTLALFAIHFNLFFSF
mgnify:CR=1 FL=1